MSKPSWRHLRVVFLVFGVVGIVVPTAITYTTRSVHIGWNLAAPLNWLPPLLALVPFGLGLALVSTTVTLFATVGEGTPAPWDPPRKLVVRGPYRHMRNPMVIGGALILLGEAIFLGSIPLAGWLLVVLVANAAYIFLFEEPALARRFGDEYLVYKQNVPRWIPRRNPWVPPAME
jgi:protein-S-isoprenylcysteine O-methyltransferase Ste14